MTKKKLYSLSFLSGILFFLSWPPYGFPFLLFIAFVPLLQIEHAFSTGQTAAKRTLLFWLAYLTFFIWNIATTWWVYNASLGGAAMAILANSFLMAAIFWIFHVAKKRLLTLNWKPQTTNWLFPIFWLAFEFFHHRWDLTWPWLTVGNAFASFHTCVQWYEYTGTGGGSLWVLGVNLMVFELVKHKYQVSGIKYRAGKILLVIIAPILLSLGIYFSYEEKSNPVNIVVVQPNIDPYSEKFSGLNFEEQLEKMLELAKQKVDSSTDYLVFPETALTENIWENDLNQTQSIVMLKEFLKPYPKLKIITGASSRYFYENEEKPSVTARKFTQQDGYYDAFNTAFQIDSSNEIQIYHKSKLVPGVERMPYPAVFGFLENLAIDMGGTSGSLGTQEERTVFKDQQQIKDLGFGNWDFKILNPKSLIPNSIAPVVCYESVFGEYVGEYVRNGATLIFIITNDGWWGNTPGYKQHLMYGRLRAIETRRSIARSANTGISCFMNERGDILQPAEWWKAEVIKGSININSEKTYYVKKGDMIGRICFYVSAIVLLFVIFNRFLLPKKSTL